MADNITVSQGSGTTMATDDISSVQYPRVKISWGVDGSAVDASAAAPFPTVQTGALPAGTNNIGDVDVLSVVPGTSATSLGKAEDAAHSSGDTGVMALAVRNDAGTTLAGTDGDYAPLSVNSAGAVYVTGATSTQYTEDAAAAADPVGTAVNLIRADSLAAITSADGDNVAARGTNKGELYVKHVDAIPVTDNSSSLTVDNAALSVVGGGVEAAALRVTIATDSTGVLSVDDNGGSLTVDGSVTANAGTNLNTSLLALEAGGNLAGAATSLAIMDDWDESDRAKVNSIVGQAGVAGGSGVVGATTQRVVLATDVALPAGTNAIGKLAANSGVDIGDVDVTSILPGTGALNLGKIEDAAHASGDVGVMALGVRNDAGTAFAADGDYVPLSIDASGAVRVTGGGGGTQYTEDAAAAANPVGSALNLIRQDTLSGLVSADGDNVAARGTDKGELYVKHVDAIPVTDGGGSLSVDDGGGSLTVDGTVAATQSGTWIVQPGNTANTTAWKVDASSVAVPVTDNSGSLTVDNAGTFAVQATIGAGALNIGKFEDTASGDGDEGVGAMAIRKATPANLSGTDGDYEFLQMSAGRLWTSAVIDTALPAGTNAIGKLAANSGIDIGDVDVTSVTPGTGATSLGKAEDAAHVSGDVGVMALAVRNDAGTTLAGTDGDYTPLSVDANGALYVTGGGGGTQYVEDAAAAANPTGTALNLIRADALAGVTSADGDNVAARGTNKGELYVKHVDAIPVTDNSGSLTVDNATLSVTGGGVEASALRVTIASDSTGVVSVDDNGGSLTVDGTVTANAGTNLNTSALALEAGGNLAGAAASLAIMDDWDESDRAKVNIIAGQAGVAGGSGTVSALTQRVVLATDVALPAGTNNIGDVDVLTQPARVRTTDTMSCALATDAIMNSTTALTPKFAIIDAATSGDNTLVASVSSKKIRVLSLMMVSAGTVTARFESGASGTALSGQMNLVANSGFTLPFNPVGWFETATTTLLNLELSAAISVDGMLVYVEV